MNMDNVADFASRGVKERLLSGRSRSMERLPLLRAAFDGMAAGFVEAMRGRGGPSVRLEVDEVTGGRASDAVDMIEGRALIAAYLGLDRDAVSFIAVDRPFVLAIVDALLGGDGSDAPYDGERVLTSIETRIGLLALDELAKALQDAFAANCGASFPLERVEHPQGVRHALQNDDFAVTCHCTIEALGYRGDASIVVPQSLIEPMRDALSRTAAATPASIDPIWAKRMKERVTQTDVTLSAVMEKREMTLASIARLEIGQIIDLPVSPTSLVKLVCEGEALFWCEIGQKDGAYTIRIDDFVDQEQEFIDDVIGA